MRLAYWSVRSKIMIRMLLNVVHRQVHKKLITKESNGPHDYSSLLLNYPKIPKISPSTNKPPKPVTQKTIR